MSDSTQAVPSVLTTTATPTVGSQDIRVRGKRVTLTPELAQARKKRICRERGYHPDTLLIADHFPKYDLATLAEIDKVFSAMEHDTVGSNKAFRDLLQYLHPVMPIK